MLHTGHSCRLILHPWDQIYSLSNISPEKKFKYSWFSLSRTRLSRIAAYLEVKILSLPKHENLTTSKKYCGKEEKISPLFHNIFDISLMSRVQLHINLLNVVVRIIFSSILKMWYVEVRISRSVSESPLQFEITRVDCIVICSSSLFVRHSFYMWVFIIIFFILFYFIFYLFFCHCLFVIVPFLTFFDALGKLCFVIVAFYGCLHLQSNLSGSNILMTKGMIETWVVRAI